MMPKATSEVSEVNDAFDEGVNAYLAKSYKLAMVRLKPVAEQGNARAQAYLGTMFETGRGVERDYRAAMR